MPFSPRVTVVRKTSRKHLILRYRDPLTKQEQIRSAGTNVLREAERAAARWERELADDPHKAPDEMTWQDFRDRYRDQHLMSLALRSRQMSLSVLDRFEEVCKPARLQAVDAWMISRFSAARRTAAAAESTIQSELGTLRAALRWGVDVGLLKAAPHFPRVRRAKSSKRKPMKGRPIRDDEFPLMLAAVERAVEGDEKRTAWTRYLRGMWASGLRLKESLDLSWDSDEFMAVDLTHGRPMFRVPAEAEKGNKDRYLPMAPEFAAFLMETPSLERNGRVFVFPRQRNRGPRISQWRVSEVISAIGKAAGIVVDTRGPKYASAHDLRRSFGTRWAKLVMPQVLMQLMRHDSIETTMRYYVDIEAQDTTELLYAAVEKGDNPGDRDRPARQKTKKTSVKTQRPRSSVG